MASIDAMSIRGIRSFGPDEAETIKFAKPLTVIVGENGCGKTTIIECLKYVTTGCLPPGAQSGQSFVHDPKIAGRTEVKGQIKLKFKNRVPQTMVCVRDLQVTQTRTKITFKALEGVLVMFQFAEDGTRTDKVSITHACTKMDTIMPELLGVPRSVLEHVVLCHQEESNWPLAEGAKLKERFDQIFESDRYTKALNDIKKLRKEKEAERKEADHKVALSETQVNQLKSLRAKAAGLLHQQALLSNKRGEISETVESCEEMLMKMRAVQLNISGMKRAIETVRAKISASEQGLRGADNDAKKLDADEASQVTKFRQLSMLDFERAAMTIDKSVADCERKVVTQQSELASLRSREQALSRAIISVVQGGADRAAAKKALAQHEMEFMSVIEKAKALYARYSGGSGGLSVSSFPSFTNLTLLNAQSCIDYQTATVQGLQADLANVREVSGEKMRSCDAASTNASQAARKAETQAESKEAEQRRAREDLSRAENEKRSLEMKSLQRFPTSSSSSSGGAGGGHGSIEDRESALKAVLEQIKTLESTFNPVQAAADGAQLELDIQRHEKMRVFFRKLMQVYSDHVGLQKEIDMHKSQAAEKDGIVKSLLIENKASFEDLLELSSLKTGDKYIELVKKKVAENKSAIQAAEREALMTARVHTEAEAELRSNQKALMLAIQRSHEKSTQLTLSYASQRSKFEANCKQPLDASFKFGASLQSQEIGSSGASLLASITMSLGANEGMGVGGGMGSSNASSFYPSTLGTGSSFAEGSISGGGSGGGLPSLDLDSVRDIIGSQPDFESAQFAKRWEVVLNMVNRRFDVYSKRHARITETRQFLKEAVTFFQEEKRCHMCMRPVGQDEESEVEAAMKTWALGDGVSEEGGGGGGDDGKTDEIAELESLLANAISCQQWMMAKESLTKEAAQLQAQVLKGINETMQANQQQTARTLLARNSASAKLRELKATETELSSLSVIAQRIASAYKDARDAEQKEKEVIARIANSADVQHYISQAQSEGFNFNLGGSESGGGGGGGGHFPTSLDETVASLEKVEGILNSLLMKQKNIAKVESDREGKRLALQRKRQELVQEAAEGEAQKIKMETAVAAVDTAKKRSSVLDKELEQLQRSVKDLNAAAALALSEKESADAHYRKATRLADENFQQAKAMLEKMNETFERVKKAHAQAAAESSVNSGGGGGGGGGGGSGFSNKSSSTTEQLISLLQNSASDLSSVLRASSSLEKQMEILNSAKSKCESEIEKAQLDVDRLQKEARATSAGRAAIGIVRRMFELDSTRSALLQEKAKLESELRAVIVDNRIAEMRETAGLGAFIPGSDKNSSSSSYNRNKDNEIDLISEDEEEADETASRKRARGSSVAPSSAISNSDDPIAVLENTIWLLDQRLKSLLQDQARIDGQISIVSTSMKEARKEEETNLDLVNCEKRYRDALVEATVLENIVADLETYQKALDSALMRYHQIKVAEINNIIRELWQSTYKGADIDNIEIASDFEEREDGASSTAKGSKSYNYRVCMAKGEAKLDMRGRCSAGQKVLASIVIRLALAETFCVNTGILALDEPTTNLDLPNKKGLAEALAKVIELRRGSNLQLIVITHDEEFVSELSRALEGGGGTDSKNQIGQYYRVFREEVRPGVFHSHVQAQDFD